MPGSDIIKLLLPLIIITVLLLGVLFLLKRINLPGKRISSDLLDLKVITTYPLMPKKYLTVVKVNDKLLLLGVSEHSITLLKELDIDPDEFTELSENEKQSFTSLFLKNLKSK